MKIFTQNRTFTKEVLLASFYLIFGILVFSTLILHENDQWQKFDAVHIDYNFQAGHALHHFVVRKPDNKFLIAGDTPNDMRLNFKFTRSSAIKITVTPRYPSAQCKSKAIGKANIRFTSKNINKTLLLNATGKQEFQLNVFDTQPLFVSINNTLQKNCGRADIWFQSPPNKYSLIRSYLAFWLCIMLILILAKQQNILFLSAISLHAICLKAIEGFGPISLAALQWANGVVIIVIGLILIIRAGKSKWLRRSLFILVTSLFTWFFSTFILYKMIFKKAIDDDSIHAILQTHPNEIWEFLLTQIGISALGIVIVPVFLVLVFGILDRRKELQRGLVTGFALLLLGLTLLFTTTKAPLFLQVIDRSINSYFFELELFASLKEQRGKSTTLDKLSLELNEKQNLIVVIGESANRNHLEIYGYGRNTTPFAQQMMDANKMLRFDFAYSNHTHTNPSLSYALTNADQYDDGSWMTAPSIFNIANTVGINTFWITNQQLLGAWDNHVSLIAQEASKVVTKNKLTGKARSAKDNDEVLLDEIKKTIFGPTSSNLIFVHLQGSHANYCSRFPKDKALFDGQPASRSIFGNQTRKIARTNNSTINCYDDSIRYTDFVLNEITSLLDVSGKPSALLYFSDHSEDVVNIKAHNSAQFTYDMAEIPLLFWSNNDWRIKFESRWNGLEKNRQKDFTNDHIFETVAGLLGISSSKINKEKDLSSFEYREREPKTLHGKKLIKDVSNWAYWQRKNTSKLSNIQGCLKLLPHRVNSISKAREALASGVCGIEVDIMIEQKGGEYVFQVGHDKDKQANISLEHLLNQISEGSLEKIWLDIKNLNASNLDGALTRLDQLDSKFNLKKRSIIETSFYGKEASLISKQDYKLSYYIPTKLVLETVNGSIKDKSKLASNILNRIRLMNATEISFDLRLYTFVKSHLEPKLPTNIQSYHSWFPEDLTFYTPTLLDDITEQAFYRDTKMRTILLPYASPFSL